MVAIAAIPTMLWHAVPPEVSPEGKEVIQAPYVDPPEEEVFAAPPEAR